MGNNISLDQFERERSELLTDIAASLTCMGLGPELAIVQREQAVANQNGEAWWQHLQDLRARAPTTAAPARVHIVMDKLQSLWSPARCQFDSLQKSVYVDMNDAASVPMFDYKAIDDELEKCQNQYLYVTIIWHWVAPDTTGNHHLTLLLFNRKKLSIEFFDPTDGTFTYLHPATRLQVMDDRWRIMQNHILPRWRKRSWKYLKEQTPVSSSPVQDVIESGWTDVEARSVIGYCAPIVILLYCLCLRMNLVSPTVAAIGLVDYVSHHFSAPRQREDFRTGLMLWYQRLYNAGSFKSICERIGLRKEPFLLMQSTQKCGMYIPGGVCRHPGYNEWSICQKHRETMIVEHEDELIIPHYPHDATWNEETGKWRRNRKADHLLADVRRAAPHRKVKLEEQDRPKRQRVERFDSLFDE